MRMSNTLIEIKQTIRIDIMHLIMSNCVHALGSGYNRSWAMARVGVITRSVRPMTMFFDTKSVDRPDMDMVRTPRYEQHFLPQVSVNK